MKIIVDCPACPATFQVSEQYAGKRGRCPHCKEVFRVPDAPSAPAKPEATTAPSVEVEPEEPDTYGLEGAPTAGASARMTAARASAASSKPIEAEPTRPTRTPVQILAAFRGEIEPVRPTMMYRLWILIIAFVMVLLPAVYLGLVGVVGYLLYLHATTNVAILQQGGRNSAKAALIVYLGPIVAGAIVIAFMLKPLFAKAGKKSKVRQIDPSKEPLIAAFVDGVCTSVGSPTPCRIEVDCRVNASAHLASWVLSPSKELVLTIGLPLVAGLTLREFTGVLAHEFGHFSQGAGMKLSILIRSINLWFARVVYERDEWDETLASWSSMDQGSLVLIAYLVRASVWLTRRVLWVLMHLGHLVSGFLSRQMEFDADRYQARMVGGEVVARTMERLNELGLAWNVAHSELETSWRERRLPDDLPRLVLVEASKIPDPVRDALRESMEIGRTGLFDTHPADRERIARALDEAPEGIFRLDGPATDLFRDFDALSRATTYDYYRSMLGREVTREQLFPVNVALLNQEVKREGSEAFDRFFLETLGPIQALPLPVSYPQAPTDPKAAKRELMTARHEMLATLARNHELMKRWGELHDQAVKAKAATILLKVGKKSIKPRDFGLAKASLPLAEDALDEAIREIEAANGELERFSTASSNRLSTALGLLEIEAVAARVPDGKVRREETRALYACAMTLGVRIVPEMEKLLRAMHTSNIVVSIYQAGKNNQDEAMINALLRCGRLIHESLTELQWKIGNAIPYPFEHAQERITLSRYALPTVPDPQAIGDLLQAGSEVQDRVFSLHHRVLGRLAATSEAVEKAIGLQPLKAPQREAGEVEEG